MLSKLYNWYGRKAVWAVSALFIGLITVGLVIKLTNGEVTEVEVPLPTVRTATAASLSGSETVTLLGTVRAVSEAQIQTETAGRVTSVPVALGQAVGAGQIIATLENAQERAAVLQAQGSYEAAQASASIGDVSVTQAETSLSSAKNSAVSTVRSSYSTVSNLFYTTIDDLYGNVDFVVPGVKVDNANNQFLNAERVAFNTILDTWQTTSNTITITADLGDEITESLQYTKRTLAVVDEFVTALNVTDQQTISGVSTISHVASFTAARAELISTIASLENAENALQSAVEAVLKAELGGSETVASAANAQVKQALGALRSAEANLAKTILRSPIAGTVNELDVKLGDFIGSFAPVAKVANNNALEVTVFVGENDLKRISVGQIVMIEGVYEGVVTNVGAGIDADTQKTEVKIATETDLLINGDTVAITLEESNKAEEIFQQIILPITAVKFTGETGFIYTIEDGVLVAYPVTIGAIRGSSVEIIDGLSPEMKIVVDARGLVVGSKVDSSTNMWSFFIRNSSFAYLLLLALIIIGGYTIIAIPKESAPEVIVPVGIVSTILPGAPATDIETLITNELERGLVSLENVKDITSVSRENVSSITVEFEASADLDESIDELKSTVDALKSDLPSDAEDPVVSEVNFTDQPIMTIALSGDVSDFAFTDLIDDVENEIESIAGVSRVTSSGVRKKEVAVILEQSALLRYELSINQVVTALRNANQTLPIGQIENDGVSYNIAFEGDLADSSQIANVSVATRGGQPVYIRDIATVEDGLTPATTLSRLSLDNAPSRNSISVDVYKQSGGDITVITRNINDRLIELQEPNQLLSDVDVLTVLDAGDDILEDLVRLSASGFQTISLVVLLLIVAIGWREGLLAGTAIPLSFLFGFIGLYFSGNTVNFLSLFSLILGIGILVDSAIVMVEGINKKMKDDPTIDKRVAALETINEFKAPLISGTLTTVSMFVGLFIVSGVIGQFIASIPFTLIFLLFASMFVAIAIIPLLASSFLRRRSSTKLEQKQVEYAHKLESWYRGKLEPFIDDANRGDTYLTLIFALLVFSIFLAINVFAGVIAGFLSFFLTRFARLKAREHDFGSLLYRLLWLAFLELSIGLPVLVMLFLPGFPSAQPVEVTFFEQSDVEFVIIEIEQPEGTTKEITDVAARRVEEILYQQDNIESYVLTVGSGSQFGGGGSGEKFANIFVTLHDDRDRNSTEIVEILREAFTPLRDIKVTVNQPSDGPPTGAAIIVKFLGDDLRQLTEIANQAGLVLRETTGIVNVETSTNSNNTEFVLNLDRAKAASLGLDAFTISQIARTAVFGTDATSLTTLDDDIDVVVKLNVANQTNVRSDITNEATIGALNRISIPTQNGDVPLSSLVDVSLRESSSVIRHEDQKRVVTLQADVSSDVNAREAQAEAISRIESEIDIPSSVTISTGGGETDESNEAFLEMFLALVVGIILMVGVLVLQFNSYLHMSYVLSILPYSLIGIFVGLALTQNPLSFPSMMGFIALSGIVVNNSILLIDMMNNMRQKNPDKPIRDVVIDAAASRLRPILLTTATTVIGMLPLVFAGDLWAPLAYAVMFGLLFSVFITLVLIPITYYRKPGRIAN